MSEFKVVKRGGGGECYVACGVPVTSFFASIYLNVITIFELAYSFGNLSFHFNIFSIFVFTAVYSSQL